MKDFDQIAQEMEMHIRKVLELCDQLEKNGCRGDSIKCPFFHVSCYKLLDIGKEFLQELDIGRKESQ